MMAGPHESAFISRGGTMENPKREPQRLAELAHSLLGNCHQKSVKPMQALIFSRNDANCVDFLPATL